MPSVCFYFEVHQPYRVKKLRRAECQDGVFDEDANCSIMRKVAAKCYLPTNALLLELIEQYQGAFKISFAITGVALQQMELYCPEVIESYARLAKTGCVEFVGETHYHSLAALYDETEFKAQVALHTATIERLFGLTPRVFRNTELIYDDRIGRLAGEMGFRGVIAEGPDDILDWRSPNFVYQVPGTKTALLLKNYKLSDDIAFRFSNRAWSSYPLTSERYAEWLHALDGNGQTVNLFMDYETFGEHQWADSGIFDFLRALPGQVLSKPSWSFKTPSETIDAYEPTSDLSFHRLTSWADMERDITAWRGNQMQERALREAYSVLETVKATGDSGTIHHWRKLLTSDHFYYMCTKFFADGDVHAYFSPYESPYEAFMFYMAALNDLQENLTVGLQLKIENVSADESLTQIPVRLPDLVSKIVREIEPIPEPSVEILKSVSLKLNDLIPCLSRQADQSSLID